MISPKLQKHFLVDVLRCLTKPMPSCVCISTCVWDLHMLPFCLKSRHPHVCADFCRFGVVQGRLHTCQMHKRRETLPCARDNLVAATLVAVQRNLENQIALSQQIVYASQFSVLSKFDQRVGSSSPNSSVAATKAVPGSRRGF